MTLYDFINELKHNGLNIMIYCGDECVFCGTVSSFKHWVNNSLYFNKKVIYAQPFLKNGLGINLVK